MRRKLKASAEIGEEDDIRNCGVLILTKLSSINCPAWRFETFKYSGQEGDLNRKAAYIFLDPSSGTRARFILDTSITYDIRRAVEGVIDNEKKI